MRNTVGYIKCQFPENVMRSEVLNIINFPKIISTILSIVPPTKQCKRHPSTYQISITDFHVGWMILRFHLIPGVSCEIEDLFILQSKISVVSYKFTSNLLHFSFCFMLLPILPKINRSFNIS